MRSNPNFPQILILLCGRFLSDFGRGFTMPFFPIYFKEQVGLTGKTIGLGMLGSAIMGGVAVLVGAYFTDKIGRKKSLLFAMLASAIVHALYPRVNGPVTYILVCVVSGGALALYWPAASAMLTDLTGPADRARVFSWLRVAVNAGIGLGTLGGGLTLWLLEGKTADPALPYHMLFYIDALTYLLFFLILKFFVRETLTPSIASTYGGFRSGWGEALRDGNLIALFFVNLCFIFCFSLFLLGFANFYKQFLGMGPAEISIVFGINTAMIVFLQVAIWEPVDHWPRTRALCLSALFFSLGLGVLNLCAIPLFNGFVVVLVSMIIFTLGEMYHGPAITSLFSNLAPQNLRGTYMSVFSLTWAAGMGLGPVISGVALDAGVPYFLWNSLILLLAGASIGLVLLGRRLPRKVNHSFEQASENQA